jgi:alkylhydroperoxidase family enzyme
MLVTGDVGDDIYAQAQQHFSEAELAGLIWTVTIINAWNRIGVTTRMEPGHYHPS